MNGFPYERMHSLYLHGGDELDSDERLNFLRAELVEAAANAKFTVGWLQYRNVNVGVEQACDSSGDGSVRMKEDEATHPHAHVREFRNVGRCY